MNTHRNALITGASEGIGRAFARRLATEGYTITAIARNEKRLQELMAGLPAGDHIYQVADLSTTEGIEATSAITSTGRFHLLINNAGFGVYGAFYTDMEFYPSIIILLQNHRFAVFIYVGIYLLGRRKSPVKADKPIHL